MSENLPDAMRGRMEALRTSIVTLNTAADELVRSANLLDGRPTAALMLRLARRQRVKVLEMQGQLAILSNRYVGPFEEEP